ncbi:uncharacterized protein LOC120416433 [Culex pipiens pallens]|uniref:uncharacterized protein LOC120416433 n=1 Tax=Culex pipiens pallens TaxID=42434 RepID=UPI001952AB1A|nr:uncharacterized protein LOC120416433 [Culex pipiens pallens]
MVYRVLGFIYAVASLIGSILFFLSKDDLGSDDQIRQALSFFAVLWLIFNFVLIFGLYSSNESYVNAHLQFINFVFITLTAIVLYLAYVQNEQNVEVMNVAFFLPSSFKNGVRREVVKDIAGRVLRCLIVLGAVYALIRHILVKVIASIKKEKQQQQGVAIFV